MSQESIVRRLEILEAKVAISELKARYFHAVDLQDWDLLTSVFHLEASLTGDGRTVYGRSEVVARIRGNIEGRRLMHHGHMPEIVIHDDATASGIWAMEDLVERSPGEWFHGFGHYHETYRFTDGVWLISSISLIRLFNL